MKLQPVYWKDAEAQTMDNTVVNVTVILWDWDAKQGNAVFDGNVVDVWMTDYSECDLKIGAKGREQQ